MTVTPETAAGSDALEQMLADPEIRQSLAVLAANAPMLAALAAMATGLLQRGPELSDNVNAVIRQLRTDASYTDGGLAGILPLLSSVANRSESVIGVLDSAVLQPEVVEVIGRLGEAALAADKTTKGKQAHVGGLFAILGRLKDPQVQETLAYLFAFAEVFGARQSASGKQ